MKPASTRSIFVYGTLMAPEVVTTLLRRQPQATKACVEGYIRHPVINHVFPGLIACSQSHKMTGILYQELSPQELKILDWFEDEEYTRIDVTVNLIKEDESSNVNTQLYLWTNPLTQLDCSKEWNYQQFRATKLDWYLEHTVRPTRQELDRMGY